MSSLETSEIEFKKKCAQIWEETGGSNKTDTAPSKVEYSRLQILANRLKLYYPIHRFSFVMTLFTLLREPIRFWYEESWLFWTGLGLAVAASVFM